MTATTLPHRRGRVSRPRLAAESVLLAAAGLIAALALAPIAALAVIAAHGTGNLWGHLAQYVLPDALVTTALLLAGVGTLVTVVGVGTAWLVATCRFPGRATFEWALLLPLAVPTYIVAYAYVDVVHPLGPIPTAIRALLGLTNPRDLPLPNVRSLAGCIILLGAVLYPYVYLTARATFLVQTANAVEVARTLGTGPAAAFFRIALPLARPAIVVGVSLALMETLNDIGASEFLGVGTLTVAIYSTWVNQSSLAGAAQIALVMLLVVFGLVLAERWARRRQRFAAAGSRGRPLAPLPLSGSKAAAAFLACLTPITIGFLIPAGHLVSEAWARIRFAGLPTEIAVEALNSALLAGTATIVVVTLGLIAALAARAQPRHPAGPLFLRLASVGYAIPGTVLAVGLLTPLALFDNALNDLMLRLTGFSTGLLLSGSGVALIIAYTIRFLAISAGSVEAGATKISPHLDMAARSLGRSLGETIRAVHLPLLRPALGAAGLLVFVDCMKELPATLMLRPINFETLATHVYGEAARGTYESGAVAALLIVLVGLVPVIVLARMSRPAVTFDSRDGGSRVTS